MDLAYYDVAYWALLSPMGLTNYAYMEEVTLAIADGRCTMEQYHPFTR
jgi:hypothetical protein